MKANELREKSAQQLNEQLLELLRDVLSRSGYTDQLRRSPDPQDAARLENVEELVAVTREYRRQNPGGNLIERAGSGGLGRLGCRWRGLGRGSRALRGPGGDGRLAPGGQRRAAGKLADNNDVGRVEQQLQKAC